jgi:hypothetical protein
MAEVFYTDRLQAFPFPEFPGEPFLAEDVVWIQMALRYKLVFVRQVIYICDYLPGGLTRAGRTKAIRSPLGSMARAKLLMLERCSGRNRVKGAILYVAYGQFARRGFFDILRDSGHPIIVLASYPIGTLLHEVWKRRYS